MEEINFNILVKENEILNQAPRISYSQEEENLLRLLDEKRKRIMIFIEDIFINIKDAEMSNQIPKIVIKNYKKWENCKFDQTLHLKSPATISTKEIKNVSRSKKHFTIFIFLLSKIYCLLKNGRNCTKRELFYQNKNLFGNQSVLNHAINEIAFLLEAPTWQLGILSSSKGLIAGALKFSTSSGNEINCLNNSGISIPHDIVGIKNIETNAKFILVIEKDTIFQRLLNENILEKFRCILITGKGFPDVNTRLLLKQLWRSLKLDVFALVDADPYGIEILCVYRFGSLELSYQVDNLALPSMKWLGVFPMEIDTLNLESLSLTQNDQKKLSFLLKRDYLSPLMRAQINKMLQHNFKSEIESIGVLSQSFLTDSYLLNKIECHDYIV